MENNLKHEVVELLNEIKNYSQISEDEPLCALCKKRIVDDNVPLRIWTKDGKYEISFHIECAFKENTVFIPKSVYEEEKPELYILEEDMKFLESQEKFYEERKDFQLYLIIQLSQIFSTLRWKINNHFAEYLKYTKEDFNRFEKARVSYKKWNKIKKNQR